MIRKSIALLLLLACSAFSEEQEDFIKRFPSVGERRLKIVAERIQALGCVLDKEAIVRAKDGGVVAFKHKNDPRGDVNVVFNHLMLPKGNWLLHGAKNSLVGDACETSRSAPPDRTEAVSAVLSGRAINGAPRNLEDGEVYRMVYVQVGRFSGWDVKLGHSLSWDSAVHSFGYSVPKRSRVVEKRFDVGQKPIVNIVHRDERGELLAGALYWFEKQGGQGGDEQPATAPGSKPKGEGKPELESGRRSQ